MMGTETPRWSRPPKTLSAAVKRIETLEMAINWLNDDARSLREWGEKNAAEVGRLGRLITYRVKVGDVLALCPHANTETGKLTGNVYCSDCQEILVDNTQKRQFAQPEDK